MHYVWRTARCLHAWRSDTVAAMNMRREKWHAAELTARDYENKAQIDGLREALYQESRIKDAVIDRLHKANEDLHKAQQANGSVYIFHLASASKGITQANCLFPWDSNAVEDSLHSIGTQLRLQVHTYT